MSFEHPILPAVADGVVYVVKPNEDSIVSTHQTAKSLDLMVAKTLGVVVNQLPKYESEDKWVKRAGRIGPVIGVVPDDETVEKALAKNLPVVAADPMCPASRALKEITIKLRSSIKSKPFPEKLDRTIYKTAEEIGK